MKIAVFTNNYLPRISGVSVAVRFLLGALRGQGHQLQLIAPDYGFGAEADEPEIVRVRSLYLTPMKVSLPLKFLDEESIHGHVEEFAPDLIHVHQPFWLGKAGLEMADELRVPLVYTFHTLYEAFAHYLLVDTEPIRQAVREYVVRFANRCDLVIAPTEPIRDYLAAIGVRSRVETVPTGLDLGRFRRVTPEAVAALRREHGLQRFAAVCLSVGRLSKEKNLDLAFEAFARLSRDGRNLGLAVAGEGPYRRHLERLADKLGIAERVVWLGFLDQETLARVYFLGDLFLFPSVSDTQGIVLYEARAAGLPVVACPGMAGRALVRPGENGLFAENDPDDFAARMAEVLDAPDKFRAPFDPEAYSEATLGKKYDRLYHEALAAGRQPGERSGLKGVLEELGEIFERTELRNK